MKYILIIISVIYLYWFWKQDKKKYGKLVSPTICFFAPTFVVSLLYDFVGPLMGFFPMSSSIYIELLLASIIFSLGGFFPSTTKKVKSRVYHSICVSETKKSIHIPTKIIIFSFLICAVLLLRVYFLGGLKVLDDEDLQTKYASSGLFGHIFVMNIFLLCFYLSSIIEAKQKNVVRILIAFLFVCTVFYQVKGWMILPIVISVVYKNSIGCRQNIFKYLAIFLAIIICFILGYCISYDVKDGDDQAFLLGHFLKYFFAGVGGWSEALIHNFPIGQNPYYLLKPFSDILGIVPNKTYIGYEYVVINQNNEYTNVFTLIGSCICFSGHLLSYIYFFLLGFFTYSFASITCKRYTYGFLLNYSIICTSLAFGFFGSYFTLLNVYEMILYGFLVDKFFKRKKKLSFSFRKHLIGRG